MRIVLCNTPPDHAEPIALALVDARLAACVNIIPGVTSVYRWQGKVERDQECTLIIKTRAESLAAVTQAIRELHPYDVPEIVSLPIANGDVNREYLDWLYEATSPGDQA